jgi:hypothetical protein
VKSGRTVKIFTFLVFTLVLGIIVVLVKKPEGFSRSGSPESALQAPRIFFPRSGAAQGGTVPKGEEILAGEEALNVRVPLFEGEIIAAVLTQDLDGDLVEEQILASRYGSGAERPIRISCIAFDAATGQWKRFWTAETGVTRPGTVSLSIQDITGDRSNCIVVRGMNDAGDHTLAIFRQDPSAAPSTPWRRIADIRVDGAVGIREAPRGQAYRLGQTPGESHSIAAYGRDPGSDNPLDQIEIIYRYSANQGRFEQAQSNRLPGAQIEQRRLRELLSGRPAEFEEFISGLWYYVSSQGTLDARQYIYFDPLNREVIFYVDETQQVFSWSASSVTRYGLYISSHNVSVTTLRRSIDIELESLSSIRVRVHEDVKLPIGVNDSWDGSYRKAGDRTAGNAVPPGNGTPEGRAAPSPWVEAVYEGSIGRLVLRGSGRYEVHTGTGVKGGTYAFFLLEGRTMLELRPGPVSGSSRDIWLAEYPRPGSLILTRVNLGTRGFRTIHESALYLDRVGEERSPE